MPIPDAQINLAELVVVGRMDASGVDTIDTINIFHYRRAVTSAPPDKAELEAAFDNKVVDGLQVVLNNRWHHVATRIRWVNDAFDPYEDTAGTAQGAIAGDSLPSDKAVFILLRTGLRGKTFRGGKYIGPVSEADTTALGDVLNATALARYQALALAIITPLVDTGGNTWEPCVFTRKGSQIKTNPTTIAATTKIIAALVNQRITSLKRRATKSKY